MGRFRNTETGVVLSVDDSKDDRFASPLWTTDVDGDDEAADEGYESMTVVDLKAEIKSRNEGREGDDKIAADGNKAELVAALEADDAASADA